jgi:hypothetical protein
MVCVKLVLVFVISVQFMLLTERCHLFTLPCWPDKVNSARPPEHIELFAANTVPAVVGLTDKNTLDVASPAHETGLVEFTIAL